MSPRPNLANRIVEHYETHAAAWDRDRQNSSWNDKVWHERFVGKLAKGSTVLDLGCGSGRPVAQHMVERGLIVTGVDSSRTMVAFCRDRLPNQEWIEGDMRLRPIVNESIRNSGWKESESKALAS
jgi:ubiquinone/menaquinone biosynthesis C-methylase UbiE